MRVTQEATYIIIHPPRAGRLYYVKETALSAFQGRTFSYATCGQQGKGS